ncbi:uncharacterized protein TNCV_1032751 [Trichonephila clavipes]|nr:uncharacterized protein TNCV_1032751 [Trichonephila clavipes]
MELLRNCKDFFNDLRSDGAFAEMLCDVKELADEIDIPVNFEVTQPRHRARRKNVNFDYEARDNPVEDPKLNFQIELNFFTIDEAINALKCRFNLMSTHSNCFQFLYNVYDLKDTPKNLIIKNFKNLEMMLTDGESVDINALDLVDEIMSVSALIGKKESPLEVLKFISVLEFAPNLAIAIRVLLSLPISVANGERSFSKLKLTKNFLRSTILQERLNGLAT